MPEYGLGADPLLFHEAPTALSWDHASWLALKEKSFFREYRL